MKDDEMMTAARETVKCGDCEHFVKNGRCNWYASAEGKRKDHPFAHAPFWVWSDCYSDKEQVRADVETACKTFAAKISRTPNPVPTLDQGRGV